MTSTSNYRPDIDGLRAIAVMAVVAYHVGTPGVAGGYRGVDVFFVISGYLITSMLWQEAAATGRLSLATFYARRARRILPALLVVVVTTLLLGSLLLSPLGERQDLAKSAAAALAFAANHYFLAATHRYFDPPSELVPLLHLWSLSIEEQFYLVWPLGLLAVTKAAPAKRSQYVRVVVLAVVASSFILYVWLSARDRSAAFYLTAPRAWELLAGAFLAVSAPRVRKCAAGVATSAAVVGLALILAALCLPDAGLPFDRLALLLPVAGTLLVIFGNGEAPRNPLSRLLSARPLVGIGLVSYGWYLWHWPLLALARSMREGARDPVADAGWAIVALGLAVGTWRYVENPIRRGAAWTSRTNRLTFACAGAAMLFVGAVAVVVNVIANREWTSDTARLAWSISADKPPHQAACMLDPSKWNGALPIERCTIPADTRSPRVVLWGDSHADAWSPALEVAAGWHDASFLQLTMHSCPPLVAAADRADAGCADFNARVLGLLRSHSSDVQGVVISARWPAYFPASKREDQQPDSAGSGSSSDNALQAFASQLSATLSLLQGSGVRTLIVLQPPHFAHSLPKCIETRPPSACGLDRASYDRQRRPFAEVIQRVAAKFPDVRVVDPVDFFCDREMCAAFLDNRPAVSDDNHVSASASRAYAYRIEGDLEWLFGVSQATAPARDKPPR